MVTRGPRWAQILGWNRLLRFSRNKPIEDGAPVGLKLAKLGEGAGQGSLQEPLAGSALGLLFFWNVYKREPSTAVPENALRTVSPPTPREQQGLEVDPSHPNLEALG